MATKKKFSPLMVTTGVVWGLAVLTLFIAMWSSGNEPQSTASDKDKQAAVLRAERAKNRPVAQASTNPGQKRAMPTRARSVPTRVETTPEPPTTRGVVGDRNIPRGSMRSPRISDSGNEEAGGLRGFINETRECFDDGDYDCALKQAVTGLEKYPKHIQLKRWAIASACQMNDETTARRYFDDIPPAHQRAMRVKCKRVGINL